MEVIEKCITFFPAIVYRLKDDTAISSDPGLQGRGGAEGSLLLTQYAYEMRMSVC